MPLAGICAGGRGWIFGLALSEYLLIAELVVVQLCDRYWPFEVVDCVTGVDQQIDHASGPRQVQFFKVIGQFTQMMCIAQSVFAEEVTIGLPAIVNQRTEKSGKKAEVVKCQLTSLCMAAYRLLLYGCGITHVQCVDINLIWKFGSEIFEQFAASRVCCNYCAEPKIVTSQRKSDTTAGATDDPHQKICWQPSQLLNMTLSFCRMRVHVLCAPWRSLH